MAVELDIDALRQELASSPLEKKPASTRGVVMSLMPELLALLENGYRVPDLVKWFAEKGVSIPRNTLQVYITEARNKGVKPAVLHPAYPVASPPEAGASETVEAGQAVGNTTPSAGEQFRLRLEQKNLTVGSLPPLADIHEQL